MSVKEEVRRKELFIRSQLSQLKGRSLQEWRKSGVKQDESQKSAGVNECGSFDQEVFDRQSHWGHLDLPESISPGRKDPEIRKLLESTFQCPFHNDQEAGKLLKLSRIG